MHRLIALAALPGLAACATSGDRYPSLAIRDVERAEGRFAAAPAAPLAVPEVAVPDSGPLPARLAALSSEAEAAHRAFTASAPNARRMAAAAAGAAIGAPAWASAQVALSDLDSARSRTATTLAELDTLMVATAVQAQDVAPIETVRQQVLVYVGEEDAVLADLRARIR